MGLHARQFDSDDRGPLDGLRVLDMSRLVAGNMLTLQLADFGAEVVKIEALPNGDPLRAWGDSAVQTHWKTYCRNKKSVSVNLREDDGRALVRRLAGDADALVENFIPGRLEEMGLGPEVLHADNPGLLVVRVSGFGQTGPYRERPGFGTLVEAMSGFAARNGFPDREPVLPPMALADMAAGLYGAMAVLIALREREVKGDMEREQAEMGLLVTLEPPTAPMRQEAAAAGFYVPEHFPDREFPRVQIATIEELLNGQGPDVPRIGLADAPTFRRAARHRRSEGKSQRML